MTSNPLIEAIAQEAQRMEEDGYRAAVRHANLADFWDKFHLVVGVPTTVLAALASGSALSQSYGSGMIAGGLGLVVTALTAGTMFINPAYRANLHQQASTRYLNLGERLRLFRALDCRGSLTSRTLTRMIKLLEQEWEELNTSSPTTIRYSLRGRQVFTSPLTKLLRKPRALLRVLQRWSRRGNKPYTRPQKRRTAVDAL